MDSERNGGNRNMKTDNALLEKMFSDENLGLALAQVRRNKGASLSLIHIFFKFQIIKNVKMLFIMLFVQDID